MPTRSNAGKNCSHNLSALGNSLHVLIVTSGGIGFISGDVELSASLDGDISIADRVTGTDLRALGVKGNGEGTASLDTGSLTGVVDNRLVVLMPRSVNA